MPERVSVRFYICEETNCQDEPSLLPVAEQLWLEYTQDGVQDVADLLMSNPNSFTPSMCRSIQEKLCTRKYDDVRQELGTPDDCEESSDPSLVNLNNLGLHSTQEVVESDLGSDDLNLITEPDKLWLELCGDIDVKITQSLANLYSHLEWNHQATTVTPGKNVKSVRM